MGDLNIVGPKQGMDHGHEYEAMVQSLSQTTGRNLVDLGIEQTQGTSDATAPAASNRIDYIIALTSSGQGCVEGSANIRTLLDENVREGSLSDHSAVVSEVKFSNFPNAQSTELK